jgi:hypothetical protein
MQYNQERSDPNHSAHSWPKGRSDTGTEFSWPFPRVVVVYHDYGGKAHYAECVDLFSQKSGGVSNAQGIGNQKL